MDFYRFLLDIQALDNVIKKHMDESLEEKGRIEFLEKQKHKRHELNNELNELKTECKTKISNLEKELFDIDEKIAKSEQHLSQVMTEAEVNALNKEIETLTPQKDQIEEEVLELLDKVDELEEKLEIDKEYFSGIQETIAEIQEEVDKIDKNNSEEIIKLEKQIEGLLPEIPIDFRPTFENVREKFRFNDPVTKLLGTSCSKCRMQISSGEAAEINNSYQHKICSGCGRILISNQIT
jgi:predicted  nucleic acid-binding Zn-ribbon protein